MAETECAKPRFLEDVDVATLKAMLSYEPDTGVFTWLIDRPGRKAGSQAGAVCGKRKSLSIGIHNTNYLGHRLAWVYMTGEWPRGQVDHINRNRLDNRFSNLRLATPSQNIANKSVARTCKSKLKGVMYDERYMAWNASITVDGKHVCIGRFDDPIEAGLAYREAAAALYGEFGEASGSDLAIRDTQKAEVTGLRLHIWRAINLLEAGELTAEQRISRAAKLLSAALHGDPHLVQPQQSPGEPLCDHPIAGDPQ